MKLVIYELGVLGISLRCLGFSGFVVMIPLPAMGFFLFRIEQPHLQQAAKESKVPLSSPVLAYEFVYSSDRLVGSISTVTMVILQFETNCSRKIDTEMQTHF